MHGRPHDSTPAPRLTRRAVPPVLAFALALWVACACVLQAACSWGQGVCLAACVGAACAVLACAAVAAWRLRGKGKGRVLGGLPAVALVVVLGVAVGAALGAGKAASLQAGEVAVGEAGAGTFEFTVVEDASCSDYGASATAVCRLEGGQAIRVRLYLGEDEALSCGERIAARCTLRLAGSEASAASLWRRGCVATVQVGSFERLPSEGLAALATGLRDAGKEVFGAAGGRTGCGQGAMLMRAIVLGDRADLFASGVYGDVKACGLAHLVAVSGSHLALVCGLLSLALRALRLRRAALAASMAAFSAFYVLLTGAPVSAVRAAAMTCCGLAAELAGRRGASLNALAVCACAIIAADPTASLSISLQLSAAATFGIAAFAPAFGAWLREAFAGHAGAVADAAALTLAANLFTVPISITTFHQCSLVSLAANILAAAPFAVLCAGGTATALVGAAVPAAAAFPADMLCGLAQAACSGMGLAASLPYACIPIAGTPPVVALCVAAACLALLAATHAPKAAAFWKATAGLAAATCACVLVLPWLACPSITALDVGQGDAILMRDGASAVLVDVGTNDSAVLAGLGRTGVSRLDGIVVTHPDDDHCGSLSAVLDAVDCGVVYVARDLLSCSCEQCAKLRAAAPPASLVALDVGDELRFGAMTLRVASPESFTDEGGNDDSVVLYASVDCDADGACDWTALLCGDAEAEVLDGLVESGDVGRVDVLKVAHHGSAGAVDDAFLAAAQPKIALLSVGAGNRYGHPTQETLDALAGAGVKTYRTDEQGDVVCEFTAQGIRVRCLG